MIPSMCFERNPPRSTMKAYVQNSVSPVGFISPPHLGQVCLSQIWILLLPHLKQSRPTSVVKEWATRPIPPPTTMF